MLQLVFTSVVQEWPVPRSGKVTTEPKQRRDAALKDLGFSKMKEAEFRKTFGSVMKL